MSKLSVVISAYNEEKKIEDCLKSVKFADEIIFVDNTSTDKTVEIAKKYTDKVFTRVNNPMLNVNKNFGFLKASGEWILSLDADERVSSELADEIKKVISGEITAHGYLIPRKNIIFGKWIQNSIWWPDYQLRLFKKEKGKFPGKHVHELVEVVGDVEKLTHPLVHYNYETVSQYLYKLDKIYTENEAENFLAFGKKLHYLDVLRFPVEDFLKTFFLQKGYRDGLHGLVLSLLQSFYAIVVFAKIWEKQGFPEENGRNFLKDVFNEYKNLQRKIMYWFLSSFISESKNIVEKNLLRIKRKQQQIKIKK
ncbi:glycosyltransferase family 2 protein [soil metagenome]